VAALVPNKQDMITKVCRIRASVIVSLLTVMLWRQEPQRAGRHIVGVGYLQNATVTTVIEYRPGDSAHLGRTGGAVKSFDCDGRSHWGLEIVRYIIGDTGTSCPSINKYVEGVGIEDRS
jgi:hypothetical protein